MDPSANEPTSKPANDPGVVDINALVAEEEAHAGWGQRELTMVAAALIGSGAITLMMLSLSGTSTSAAPGPVTTARPPARAAESASVRASWTQNSSQWTGGARKSVAFELAARNETQVWMKTVRPMLVVRCIKGRTDAFVYTESAAAMEPQDENHGVRLAFDGAEPRTERWPDSTEHDALFAPNGRSFVAELERAQTFKFGYTPHNAAPVVAQFDVAGLGQKLAASRAGCGK